MQVSSPRPKRGSVIPYSAAISLSTGTWPHRASSHSRISFRVRRTRSVWVNTSMPLVTG